MTMRRMREISKFSYNSERWNRNDNLAVFYKFYELNCYDYERWRKLLPNKAIIPEIDKSDLFYAGRSLIEFLDEFDLETSDGNSKSFFHA